MSFDQWFGDCTEAVAASFGDQALEFPPIPPCLMASRLCKLGWLNWLSGPKSDGNDVKSCVVSPSAIIWCWSTRITKSTSFVPRL